MTPKTDSVAVLLAKLPDSATLDAVDDAERTGKRPVPITLTIGECRALRAALSAQGEAVYQCMCTDEDDVPNGPRDIWMDVDRESFDKLRQRDDVRSRVLYLHPAPPGSDAVTEEVAKLRRCLGFFASVIKSGEPWTATCESEYAAALAARAEPQAGEWVLVPREPTQAMVQAGLTAKAYIGEGFTTATWKAMLAAAPSPASRARPEAQGAADQYECRVILRDGFGEWHKCSREQYDHIRLTGFYNGPGGAQCEARALYATPPADRAPGGEVTEALRAVLPYVATTAVGCHGDKCREPWCYSCFGEEAADEAASKAREAYHAAHAALAARTAR